MHTTRSKRKRAAKRVRWALKSASVDTVATSLGVPRSTVWRWETGKRLPSALATAHIFKTLGA